MPQFPQLGTAGTGSLAAQSPLTALSAIISVKGSESVSVPQRWLFPPNTICMETDSPSYTQAPQESTSLRVKEP